MKYSHNKKLVTLARTLRNSMTKEERKLWYEFLSKHTVRFYRQKIFGNYIADFYSAQAKLVIELDGSQHFEDENMKQDNIRTEFLEELGLKVVRIPNNQINNEFPKVCEYINNELEKNITS